MGKHRKKGGRGSKGCKRKITMEMGETEGDNVKTPASSDNGEGTDEPRWNPGHSAQSKLDPDKSWAPKCKSKFTL